MSLHRPKPLRIVFMGTPVFSARVLEAILARGHQVVACYTRAPKPGGRRGLALTRSPVHELAECHEIPVFTPRSLRGNLIEDDQLSQVVVGVSSRNDVLALLGSPSATGTFDDSEWFYIGGVTRQRPGRLLGIEEQRVVIMRFDQRGTLREVRRLGVEDGRDIAAVSRITPTPGNERSFLQQLFGNIGRVGPGVTGGQSTGPGAPSSAGGR